MNERVGPVFAALSDPTRRRVIERLAEGESLTATELAAELPITRQAVSKHLVALAEAGLVAPVRVGRETRYTLSARPMTEAASWMAEVGAEWDDRLTTLREDLTARSRRPGS
jgi:DNA-binding transcriptional ArsR family regulator